MPETVYRDTGEPVQPLGWQGNGLDFEVATVPDARGRMWRAYSAYWRDELVARRYARTRLGLEISMRLTSLRWKAARRAR